MKQILVAIDEHPHAAQVMDEGIALAKATSAKIVILFVVEDKRVPARFIDVHGDSLPEHYYLDEYHRNVDKQEQKIHAAGIEHEGVCGVGDPRDLILKVAKKRAVDYVVVGRHAHKGLGRLRVISDVTVNVIENSRVPVLAVP